MATATTYLPLLPMPGAELAAYINEIVATPPDIIRKTNEVIAAR